MDSLDRWKLFSFVGVLCTVHSEYSAAPFQSVWRIKAEGKICFFMWLLLHNRLWTVDRLAKRGWPHNALCVLCDQVQESSSYIILDCPFAKELWHSLLSRWPWLADCATNRSSVKIWWRKIITGSVQTRRSWCLWWLMEHGTFGTKGIEEFSSKRRLVR